MAQLDTYVVGNWEDAQAQPLVIAALGDAEQLSYLLGRLLDNYFDLIKIQHVGEVLWMRLRHEELDLDSRHMAQVMTCLLYTSDAADE